MGCQLLPPTPLLLFPEEEATNGREGLLRFRWVSTGICLQLEVIRLGGPRVFTALPTTFLVYLLFNSSPQISKMHPLYLL